MMERSPDAWTLPNSYCTMTYLVAGSQAKGGEVEPEPEKIEGRRRHRVEGPFMPPSLPDVG